jgi:hypothetical protein
MSLTAEQLRWVALAASYEGDLLQVGIDAIPPVFRDNARSLEDLKTLARQAAVLHAAGDAILARARVETATVDASGADWLDFLAGDFGTQRTNNEPDVVTRMRIRSPSSAVIRSELLGLAQNIVVAAGVSGFVSMVEMPRDAAFFGSWNPDTGAGGTIAAVAGGMSFTPAAGFSAGHPPFWGGESGRVRSASLVLTGSTHAGNDGTFVITGLKGNAVLYTNASAVAGTDDVSWSVNRYNAKGIPMNGGKAFMHATAGGSGLGHRMWRSQKPGSTEKRAINGIIMILPYGCTDSTRRSVQEMLRQRAAAGVIKRVEYRQIP